MNEAGTSAGPARGALGVDLDRVLAIHDEIDVPFGEVRVRQGGGGTHAESGRPAVTRSGARPGRSQARAVPEPDRERPLRKRGL